jgi:hypothetical protein
LEKTKEKINEKKIILKKNKKKGKKLAKTKKKESTVNYCNSHALCGGEQ